ncbi:hypothetical protein KI387_015634 [Taxus chinensis]|uniref:Non-haem dioxygenase N-terminal domain-containing protein n=1 Tax=Taxus chinensis TaxID=29808 RepID=A0AA38GFG0_TAXCH|nr:hypothetical protein KI387_015634 [Taxus chinensis]
MAAGRVQSIAGSGLQSLPPQFIRALHERPGALKSSPSARVPLIDLSNLGQDVTAHLRAKTVAEIGNAAEEWGLFIVVNHGVPEQLIRRLQEAGKEFFELPQEEKERHANQAEEGTLKEGYGTKLAHNIDGKLGWNDYYFHMLWLPSVRNIQTWPKRPSSYAYIVAVDFFTVGEVPRLGNRASERVTKMLDEMILQGGLSTVSLNLCFHGVAELGKVEEDVTSNGCLNAGWRCYRRLMALYRAAIESL